ncbi:Intron-binding protein aquarius [Choanephora cucurbitarum]|uniref:Pre-mRNA-splicing factor n=1 Tax=Choanephora cucurbitarum TaxID=101091 RepID=A0A1C7N6F1_9FUNG|nr:Intron-binding protein aquarius [Choanephora cucurbitarum]
MFHKTTLPLHAVPSEVSSLKQHGSLTLADIQSDNTSKLAQKHFDAAFDPTLIEDIYTNELKASQFSSQKLMLLEFNQYLEKYLWPHYTDKASVNHVISICLIVNEKARQHNSVWDAFREKEKFSHLFRQVIEMLNDTSLDLFLTRQLLTFMIICFQSFENDLVRTECLKLVTIGIWTHLAYESTREQLFDSYPNLLKLWNSYQKKWKAADEATQQQWVFERNWLSQLLHRFIDLIYQIPGDQEVEVDQELIYVCERFLEFFVDLEAQLPTRRFFNTLLDDHQIVVLSQLAPFHQRQQKDVELLKKLLDNLAFYAKFEINDQTGVALSDLDITQAHCQQLLSLQRTVFRLFKEEIRELPLANLGSIETRQDLLWHLEPLSNDVLIRLCDALGIRSSPIVDKVDIKQLLIHVLINRYQKRESQIQKINSQPLYPDEHTLFDDQLIQSQFYTGDRPLALPKLNLQFLTLHDYLLRNFILYRLESAYEIRQDLEDVVKRLAPRLTYPDRKTEFAGWARMAVSIDEMTIMDVGQPNLGEEKPSFVHADISFQVARFTNTIREEWDALRKHDVLFLLSIEATETSNEKMKDDEDFRQHYGIKWIRGCEVVDILGHDGKPMDENYRPTAQDKALKWKGANRKIRVALDTCQYKMDLDNKQSGDMYQSFNILVRRKPQENNFKAVLDTIRDLMQTDLVVPDWLQKVFLGYGDPSSAHYVNMPNRERTINFRDTFLDWQHLKESFLNRELVETVEGDNNDQLEPPYVVTLLDEAAEKPVKKSKKQEQKKKKETLEISSYKVPHMGPYPQNAPKKNHIRFTPVQIESIYSGLNHGLTMVVGPPGTGKTDVAVQTMVNLYQNHPEQHTLIVTHSNQALNQIFEKMIELDIDPRHLVRLGHGEEELRSELDFSKHGRVASALERRLALLAQVDRLSQSLAILGEHGSTCETATYFYHVHVLPRWEAFLAQIDTDKSVEQIRDLFPFAQYFANVPQPIFTDTMTPEEAIESSQGCFRHLKAIFAELEDIRPFELLRSGSDRANYLLTKEAKIIAMTCTHAALKRRELVDLNFKYDNIVVEEAAQIFEIETFIPLVLQTLDEGKSRLKRVMLIGDHHQLPPVVKNSAFQKYGRMEQSMFARFVRLGVPTLQLDQQGRARPSIAKLYNWRYHPLLDDLERVRVDEYTRANAGLKYDYQLIHVDAYQGESEPVPFFYQNLGEAEYVVAMYQYMRLIGYPAEKISILTTYNGQKALINDVLEKRCGWNPYFGKPATVNTVDKYQGQQNDYVLLSLVRTKTVGHIRDIRRLVVAMSRARLGLYVFCNKTLFENCYELESTFKQLTARSSQLQILPSEKYPTERSLDAEVTNSVAVADVEEMGKLVYKLSQEQLEWMRQQEAERLAQEKEAMEEDD